MRVEVVELGERPGVLTNARRFAPAGAKVLGEILGQMQFADSAAVVLDWSNSLGQMPDEVATPILYVRVIKRLPMYQDRNTLYVDVRLDVEDIFGGDNMTAESIRDIIDQMRDKVEQQVLLRRESE